MNPNDLPTSFQANVRKDLANSRNFQTNFLSKTREESFTDLELEIPPSKNIFQFQEEDLQVDNIQEIASPTHTFHPPKSDLNKNSKCTLSIPSDSKIPVNGLSVSGSPFGSPDSSNANSLIHASSFAKRKRMKPRNSRTLELGPKGTVIFGPIETNMEASPKATYTEVMDFRKEGKADNKNLLEEHLRKRNSTVIPFVKKFMSKLKNASSFRNITQLKSMNFKLLNDQSYFHDEVVKEQNLVEAKGVRKFFLMIRTCYDSQIYRLKNMCCTKFFKSFLAKYSTVFHPYQTIRILWDICHLILILFWFFYIPLLMAFEAVHNYIYGLDIRVSFYSALFLIFDIIINLNTSYFKNGVVERRRIKIFKDYFNKRFIYDFITCLPIVLDWVISSYTTFLPTFQTYRTMHYVKFLFFIKFRTFREISNRILEKFLLKEKFQNILALFKVFFISLLMAHLFACFWYLTADLSQSPRTWLSDKSLLNSNWNTQYLYSMYWASVTMMTVGYGDITPQNSTETIVCLVSVLLGCAVYAYNINSIGMILQDLNKESISFNHNINIINQFMQRKKINTDLQMRIREYLRFIWKEENAQNLEEEHKIIELLSSSLKEELLIEAYGSVLKKYPMFFANFSETSLRKVVNIIKDIKLIPDETVFLEKGQDDLAIYFIMKGKVELFANNGECPLVVRELGVGDYFGEVAFFSGKNRFLSARSKDFTTLFCINREEFVQVLQNNSDDFEKFCMIQDQILYYDNYYPLKLRCFSCNQLGHLAGQCHLIHFMADREKVIKTFNFYVDQERDAKFLRRRRKVNALRSKKVLFVTSKKIKELIKKERDELNKMNFWSSAEMISEDDEEDEEDDEEEDEMEGEEVKESEEEEEKSKDSNDNQTSQEDSPEECSFTNIKSADNIGKNPISRKDHRKSSSLRNLDKPDEQFLQNLKKEDLPFGSSTKNIINKIVADDEKLNNSAQILSIPPLTLQKRHSASAVINTIKDPNEHDKTGFSPLILASSSNKDLRSSKKGVGTDIHQKQRKKTIESSTITSHSKNKTNSRTNFNFDQQQAVLPSNESIKKNTLLGEENTMKRGQKNRSILKVPGVIEKNLNQFPQKNSILLNKNLNNNTRPSLTTNNLSNPLVNSITTLPILKGSDPAVITSQIMISHDTRHQQPTVSSGIFDHGEANKVLDNFDRVQNFKNYFPHNNCKVISEGINMKKISPFKHSKTLATRRKSMEARLAKYTFFLDEMKEKMPAAIKKKAAIMKKKREGFMGRLPTLKDDEGGYRFDEDVMKKKQKQWQTKQYFSNLLNKEQKKLNFSDVVTLILQDPFLRKQIKKKVKIVSNK